LADSIFLRLALGVVDNGKGHCAILVLPMYSTRVRGTFGVKDFGRGEINVCVKSIGCFDKEGDIRDVRCREWAEEFGPGVYKEVINHIS